MFLTAALACLLVAPARVSAQQLPQAISRQLPAGYEILASAHASFGSPGRIFYFVVLGRDGERAQWAEAWTARPRPLLIYERRADGGYALAARNDHVALRADEGGQCDPFEDGRIVAKGSYFTVENAVACGSHWTDFVTFRFDPRLKGFVFDNARFESWSMNPKDDGDALVSDGQHVVRAKGQVVRFADWRRPG
jgi:hypothetical protein